jgi:putative tricarboxylic transport membrane protein
MSKPGILLSVGSLALALAFLIPALGFPGATREGTPGPGYFPTIVSTIIIILSIILAITYLRDKEKYFQKNETERSNLPSLLITCVAVLVYPVFFMFLPFIPLTIVYMIFLNWVYKRPWKFNILFSVLFTLTIYFIFARFLRVML